MSTIRDIARVAGVSKSTVARALNNEGHVKAETLKKIEKAVKDLSYTPNYIAKGMRTNKSASIGLFVPDYSNPFYAELFKGIETVTREAGYVNLVCHTDERAELELFYIKELLKRQIDGIIFCTYNKSTEGQKYLQEVNSKIPIVCMDPVFQDLGFSCVVSDGYAGTKMAVNHLIKTGSKHISYIKGPKFHAVTEERFQGFTDAVREHGLRVNPDYVYEAKDFFLDSGRSAASYFLSLKQRPDSIIAATDVLAIGALKEIVKNNVGVPSQMRVVGFDNIPLSSLVEPTLTTIAQPIQEMGKEAAELLIKQIRNPEFLRKQIIMQCELIVRGSS